MFDPYYLFISIVMGLIGMAAFRHGRRESSPRHVALAVALMGVPYFLTEPMRLALAGGALTCFLFWP